jgi:hypothetical protein
MYWIPVGRQTSDLGLNFGMPSRFSTDDIGVAFWKKQKPVRYSLLSNPRLDLSGFWSEV